MTPDAVLSGSSRWCVICGDNRDILPSIPSRSVDHVITDPPYEAEAHTKARRQSVGGVVGVLDIPFAAMTEDGRAFTGLQIARINRGWSLVFCQVEAVPLWRDSIGVDRYRRTQIWRKPDGAPQFTGDRPGMGYECICTHWHGERRSKWNGGGRHGFYEHPCGQNNPHPTTKPLSLMLELVSLFTDLNDIILDPFAGSGTTGVAALRLGRRAILIEREPKWAELARERCQAEVEGSTLQARRAGQLPLLAGGVK